MDLAGVKATLEGYRAGRVPADRLAEEVCRAYYTDRTGARVLQPIVEVIEKVSPGKVRLTGGHGGPGYQLEGFARTVPKEAKEALRAAVDLVLAAIPEAALVARQKERLWTRVWEKVRGFFTS